MTPSDSLQLLKDSIADCLQEVVSEGFAEVHKYMTKLLEEHKTLTR